MLGKLWSAVANLFTDDPVVAATGSHDGDIVVDTPSVRPVAVPSREHPNIPPAANDGGTEDPILVRREVLDDRLGVCGYEFTLRTELSYKGPPPSQQVPPFLACR